MYGYGYTPKCKKVSLNHVLIGTEGIVDSLCQSCMHTNCGHPIIPMEISIMGVNKIMRVYNVNKIPMAVIECEGYSKVKEI